MGALGKYWLFRVSSSHMGHLSSSHMGHLKVVDWGTGELNFSPCRRRRVNSPTAMDRKRARTAASQRFYRAQVNRNEAGLSRKGPAARRAAMWA